jgi:hypothetical protein
MRRAAAVAHPVKIMRLVTPFAEIGVFSKTHVR